MVTAKSTDLLLAARAEQRCLACLHAISEKDEEEDDRVVNAFSNCFPPSAFTRRLSFIHPPLVLIQLSSFIHSVIHSIVDYRI